MKFELIKRILLPTVFLFVGFACQEAPTGSKIGPLSVIEVFPDTLELMIDSTVQFSAIGRDADMNLIEGLEFVWESADTGIATIDSDGVVTGRALGNTTIVARWGAVESLPVGVNVAEQTTGFVTDIDGNVYQTVKIGNQWWTAENLKVTHFRNGDMIPHVEDDVEWYRLSTSAFCEYDNNPDNVDTYGLLYNWFAAIDHRNIAPEGWHVPTDEEWKQLEITLGMSQLEVDITGHRGTDQGSQLAGNPDLWNAGELVNNTALGSSGFSSLPGGYRGFAGYFYNMGSNTYFWSSTHSHRDSAAKRSLSFDRPSIYRANGGKRFGFSVRLVRD